MIEDEYKNKVLTCLESNGFKIYPEQTGKHITGAKVRIDAIIKSCWNDNLFFGIEFKGDIEQHKSLNYQLKHIKQSIDYSYSYWGKNQNKRLYIFLCPNPFTNIKENSCGGIINNDLGVIVHLLNFFHIGILDYTKYGLSFILGGDIFQRIWTEKEGLKELGKRRNFNIKTGSK